MFEIMPYNHHKMMSYNPFRELEEMSRSFWNDSNITAFRTDISEKDGVYTLEAELPGFKKEDIKIDIEKDCLTISAEHESEDSEEDKEKNFVRRERYYGSYSRCFNVRGIDTDAITAEYSDGVLKVSMPTKAPEVPPARRLEIN